VIEAHGKPVGFILGMPESAERKHYNLINRHLKPENNLKVRAEMDRSGAKIHKSNRIFKKELRR
jgi:hypothetical protein